MSGGVPPITYRAQSTLVTQRKQFAAIALARSARVASTAPFNTAGIAVDIAPRYGNAGTIELPMTATTDFIPLALCVLTMSDSRGPEDDSSGDYRSEEHTSELQSLMRISYAVFCLHKKTLTHNISSLISSDIF